VTFRLGMAKPCCMIWLLPLSRLSFSAFLCVADRAYMTGDGQGDFSNDGEKAWSSLDNSIFTVSGGLSLPPPRVSTQLEAETSFRGLCADSSAVDKLMPYTLLRILGSICKSKYLPLE
jgi:hypothetical protein